MLVLARLGDEPAVASACSGPACLFRAIVDKHYPALDEARNDTAQRFVDRNLEIDVDQGDRDLLWQPIAR